MPRTYVNNSYNRSVGRVGLPVGSAVISSGGGGGGGGSSGYSYGGGGGGGSSSYSYGGGSSSYSSSGSSSRTYVDNSMNRSLGRVGLPVGSAVHSSSGGGGGSSMSTSSGSARTYVDNSQNRSLGRVGLPVGSAVHSKSSSSSYSTSASGTYVDNSKNRSLGRVGLPVGSAVQSSTTGNSTASVSARKTYVDNAYNRQLGRVGLPYGSTSAYQSRSTASASTAGHRTYVDNAYNRRLGRVGMPIGSFRMSSKQSGYENLQQRQPKYEFYEPLRNFDWEDHDLAKAMEILQKFKREAAETDSTLVDKALEAIHRHEAAKAFSTKDSSSRSALDWVKGGEIIEFEDVCLGEKIGGGGFGDVFVGIWKERQVAVKKLRVQRVSQAKRRQFQDEVQLYSQLEHPNIVQFFGVCVTTPNLAIVMEFMSKGSLHDVLHVETRTIAKRDKFQMILDCLSALKYLHKNGFTHRDIKSMNVLVTDDYLHCKLADFGLALKDYTHSSASVADHAVVGTLKYSPPEVVEGNRLTVEHLKCTDVYALGVVAVELITEEEPYDGLNQHHVRKAIMDGEEPGKIDSIEDVGVKEFLRMALKRQPKSRPTASVLYGYWKRIVYSLDVSPVFNV